jgi:DsbC/DsbD-like thiol-disulfide interchange protein
MLLTRLMQKSSTTSMKSREKFIAAALMLSATILPAEAAMSPWSQSEGGRMRLAALNDSDSKITAIIEIEPERGWKTYWRNPGDAGLAPQIDLSQAQNLKLMKVGYPTPEIGHDEGGRFFGYHQPVSLVLELEKQNPNLPATLSANVMVGLCKDICLPFQSAFTLPLDTASQPEADEFMKIQLARAELPEASSKDFEVIRSGLTADKAFFEAVLAVPGAETPEIAVAPSDGLLLGKQAEIMRKDGKIEMRYPITRLPKTLKDATIILLVKSGGRSMETTLAVE